MKNSWFLNAFLFIVIFFGSVSFPNAEAQAKLPANFQRWIGCTVNDPTRTPLNLRARPNGRIITTMKNGTLVAIDTRTAGQKWARISVDKGRKTYTGYVLRAYLACQ